MSVEPAGMRLAEPAGSGSQRRPGTYAARKIQSRRRVGAGRFDVHDRVMNDRAIARLHFAGRDPFVFA